MKLLMISTDRKLFEEDSAVLNRMLKLANDYEQLHIIVFCLGNLRLTRKTFGNLTIVPTNSLNRFLYPLSAIILAQKAAKFLKFNVSDFITCQDPFEAGLVGVWIKSLFKLNLELQIHTDIFSRYFYKHSLLNRIRYCLAMFTLPRADRIRVVSEKLKQNLIVRGYNQAVIEVRPVAYDFSNLDAAPKFELKKNYPEFKKIILMVSRLESEKNISLAISAFVDLNRQDIGLFIVGSGREEKKLKNLVHKFNLEKKVRFEGWQNDLGSYYRGADVLLSTSLYEGYGLIFAEAEYCGLPIISTDVGIAKESGALIANNRAEIVEALNKVLN
jgi:glycosyltransferase involved in cell wall biosynthesis